MTRRFRLFALVLLLCLVSTNAQAQDDLLWQHADGRRALWTMVGTTRDRGDLINTTLLPDPLWRVVASEPYSVLFQHQGDGRLAGWRMSCGYPYESFELSPSQVPDLNWKVRGYAFFNDRFWYLIWQNEVTGQIAAWQMSGTTRLDGRLLSPSAVPDTNWRIVGVADFDLDGHSDLLWQHQSTGLIAVWYMDRHSMVDGVLVSAEVSDTNLKIRAVGDVNGDGWPDLIWQNQATGLLATWLMANRVRLDSVLISPDHVADTSWRVVGARYQWDWQYVLNYAVPRDVRP